MRKDKNKIRSQWINILKDQNKKKQTKYSSENMKAKIEFEISDDDNFTKDELKSAMIEHIFNVLDLWVRGQGVITIEFETKKKDDESIWKSDDMVH